jgi:gametolysin peptidase M11
VRRLAAFLAATVVVIALPAPVAAQSDPRAAEARGTLRILVIRATWGPRPGRTDVARQVLDDAAAYLGRVSFGQLNVQIDLTPWLPAYAEPLCHRPPTERSFFGRLGELAQDAAAGAGYDISSYRRFAYVLPDIVCGFGGLGVDREILLAHELALTESMDFVHELGHTFGLPHATGSRCARGCFILEYGDPFSPMGGGTDDFSAFEKLQLGWISSVRRVTATGKYEVDSIDRPSSEPQALVIPTDVGEYWLDHRVDSPPHLIVRVVRPNSEVNPRFLHTVYLGKADRRYAVRGVFTVERTRADGATAEFAFTWTDQQPPTRPRLEIVHRLPSNEPVFLLWKPSSDAGSGVRAYRIRVDGRVITEASGTDAVIPGLPHGRHTVGIEAIDRAGNRSRRATATVVAD